MFGPLSKPTEFVTLKQVMAYLQFNKVPCVAAHDNLYLTVGEASYSESILLCSYQGINDLLTEYRNVFAPNNNLNAITAGYLGVVLGYHVFAERQTYGYTPSAKFNLYSPLPDTGMQNFEATNDHPIIMSLRLNNYSGD